MGYPANPNPSRITQELWEFRCDMLAVAPGTDDEDSGIYANKPGYHNTRAANDPDDYSVREAPDRLGPADKAAAWDWTFKSAQSGDYTQIAIYGRRIRAAWEARDPRCNVLREFLGQTDTDSTPEGLDFRHHTTRTPDSSHSWHDHFSFTRAYVAVPGALKGVVSVARGDLLADYLAAGGKVYSIDGTGEIDMSLTAEEHNWLKNLYVGMFQGGTSCGTPVPAVGPWKVPGNSLFQKLEYIHTKIDALTTSGQPIPPADLSALQAQLEEIQRDTTGLVRAAQAAGVAVTPQ